jgi:hypothetical protein
MQIYELTQKKKVELEEGITDTLGGAVGKTVSGVKNVGSALAAPFKDVAGGYKDARMDQKVSALTDKAYRSWKSYEAQLLKATPDARQTGELKQALLAFVNKNLLGGMYLPNVINKDKITGLVDQIAGSVQSASSTQPPAEQPPATQPGSVKRTGGKVAGQLSQTPGAIAKRNARTQATHANTASAGAFGQMANQLGGTKPNTMANAPVSKTNVAKPGNPNQPQQTPLQQATALQQQVQGQKPAATFGRVPSSTAPAKPGQMPASVANSPQGKKMQKAYGKPRGGIQGMPSDLEEAIPTVKPTVRPVGSLASRSAQRNAPATTPAATTTAPASATTPAPATTPAATTTAPASATTPAPAVAPANEKDLFKQLVQQAGLAQTSAPGTGSGNNNTTNTPTATTGNQDAEGMAETLKQKLDPAIAKGLPALGATAANLTGTKQVKSTGNPAADGLLILMGFQGL